MKAPSRVRVVEVGPRDGLQNEATPLRPDDRAAFAQRRKTLANALAAGLGRSAEDLRAVIEGAGIDPSRRAETLTIFEFAELARRLS